MKLPFLKSIAALVTVLPLAAVAGPTATQGVLLMGFRSTDAGQAGIGTYVVVNIGQAAGYRDGTAGTITNINAQLEETFGAGWSSRTDILWGVGGCPGTTAAFSGDPANTLYLSRGETTPGVPVDSPLPTINTRNGRATIASNLNDALGLATPGAGFDDSAVSTHNSLVGIETDSLFNNWRVYLAPGGTSGKAGSTGTLDFAWDITGIETTPLKTLSLYRFGGATSGIVTATNLGYFKIESNGNVSFNSASAPVSYASWAASHVGGQAANLDYDGDGVPNGVEWFMGTNGNGFSANPQIVNGTISWPRASGNAAASAVYVQTSTDLSSWTNAQTGLEAAIGPVTFTLPVGQPRVFVRLCVAP
ncbi:MAG: hypothetical protein WCK77_06605 [Verrucomicrobiota bacterium]